MTQREDAEDSLRYGRELKRYVNQKQRLICPAVYTHWLRTGDRCLWWRRSSSSPSTVVSADEADWEDRPEYVDEYDPRSEGVAAWKPPGLDAFVYSLFRLPAELRNEGRIKTFLRWAKIIDVSFIAADT